MKFKYKKKRLVLVISSTVVIKVGIEASADELKSSFSEVKLK